MTDDDVATITRLPPGAAAEVEAVQGWALRELPPAPDAPARPVDLLFLHGMSAAGWLWPAPWLRRFAAAGYRCRVLALPGREGGETLASDPAALDRALGVLMSGGDPRRALDLLRRALPGAALLDGPGLGEFADAVAGALAAIGRPSVVVAHSFGGAVAQTLLRRGQAPAGTVLLCSVPPYGLWRASVEMALRDPELWLELSRYTLFGRAHADMQAIGRALLPGTGPGQSALRGVLRDESLKAMLQAGGLSPFAPFPGPRRDVLVVGGWRDRLVPPTDVQMTGLYYGGLARMLPGAGHLPMQEPGAEAELAETILDWLADRAG